MVPVISVLGKWKQDDQEFKASLGCTENPSQPGLQRPFLKPTNNKTIEEKTKRNESL